MSYGTDLNKAKEIILEVCRRHEKVLDDPEPSVWVVDFGDSSMDLMIIIWVGDLRDGWSAQCEVTQQVYEAFEENGIEIPFPTRTVYMPQTKTEKKKK